MPITNVELHPSGGYVFHTDDGQQTHLFGPDADELAQHVAANAPNAPMVPDGSQIVPIAPNDPRFRELPPEQGGDPAEFAAAQAAHGAAPVEPATPNDAAQQEPAEVAPGAAAPVPTGNPALDRMNEMVAKGATTGGAPAVTRQQLQSKASQGVPVQTGMTVSGALNETPEQKQQREADERADDEKRMAAQADIQAAHSDAVKAAQDNETAALNDVMKSYVDREQAQTRVQVAQTAFDKQQARVQGEVNAATKLTIDPGRLFRTQGIAANIFSAIAVALGGFGSAMLGTRNSALDIIQSNIDRDIAAQHDEIDARRGAANNALANIMRTHGMPLDEAKLLLKETNARYVASLTNAQAARIGTPQAKEAAAKAQIDMLDRAEQFKEQRAELTRGRASMQYSMQYPHGATQGGGMSLDQLNKVAEANINQQKARAAGKGSDMKSQTAQNTAADADEYLNIQKKLKEIGVPHTQGAQAEHDALVSQARTLRVRIAGQQARTAFGGEGGQKALAVASGESPGTFSNVLGGYDAQLDQNMKWAEEQKARAASQANGGEPAKEEAVPGATDAEDTE